MAERPAEWDDPHGFLAIVESRADLPDHLRPDTAATVTLCTLADRLTPGQGHRLFVALPAQLSPLFESCSVRYGRPIARFDDAGFLEELAARLAVTPAHAELVADVVFSAVREALPGDVVHHVASQLPGDLRDLWLGTRRIVGTVTESADALQQELLTEIAERLPLPAGISAPEALSAVMCAFSQRLSGGEARDVLLGLPLPVRGLLARCLERRDERATVFDREQLVSRVADELGAPADLAHQIVRVVLTAVKRVLPIKEQYDIASQLPNDLRETWQSA